MNEITTMGDLIDYFVKNWVVLSYQAELEKPEVIGLFPTQAAAQLWSSEHFDSKAELRHQVTWLVEPSA